MGLISQHRRAASLLAWLRSQTLTHIGDGTIVCGRSRAAAALIESLIAERDAAILDLNQLADHIHAANAKWWQSPVTGERIQRNKGELLCLIHSEISEAMEGERKGMLDDHLPHRRMAEVELADALIRILDYAAGFGYDLQGAVTEKLAYNASRADQTHEARMKQGGKKF